MVGNVKWQHSWFGALFLSKPPVSPCRTEPGCFRLPVIATTLGTLPPVDPPEFAWEKNLISDVLFKNRKYLLLLFLPCFLLSSLSLTLSLLSISSSPSLLSFTFSFSPFPPVPALLPSNFESGLGFTRNQQTEKKALGHK